MLTIPSWITANMNSAAEGGLTLLRTSSSAATMLTG
jgi:hypothetical protein